MSQSDLDQLLNQLSDEDVKVRRDAAKRLGDLAQPEAIPELANAYEKDDDEGVRKTAAEALKKFRKMELAAQNGAAGSGRSSANPLRRVRTVLLIALAVTILANVVIAAPKLFAMISPPVTQSAPTERNALIDGLKTRLTAVRGMAVLLQGGFRGLQGMGTQWLVTNKQVCDQVKANEVNTADLSALDALTYPDLREVSNLIDQATLLATGLRLNFLLICDGKLSVADLTKQLDKMGGAAKLVADSDAITNQYLGEANNRLNNAIEHPAPTVGPTVTPTNTATATGTNTPDWTVTPTNLPASAAPSAVPGSANATAIPAAQGTQPPAATPTATITPTATVTPIPTISFNGFELDKLTSYKYTLSIQADGTFINGKTFSSTLRFGAIHATSPLQSQYDISYTNVGLSKDVPGPLGDMTGLAGSTTMFVLNNTIYIIGDMLTAISPQARRCGALPLAGHEKTVPVMDLSDFPLSTSASLTAMPLKSGEGTLNGVKVKHYHGEITKDGQTEVMDVWVTDDDQQLPIHIDGSWTVPAKAGTGTPSKVTGTPGPYQGYVVSMQYDLLGQNQDVSISAPIDCAGAQPPARATAKPKATVKKK